MTKSTWISVPGLVLGLVVIILATNHVRSQVLTTRESYEILNLKVGAPWEKVRERYRLMKLGLKYQRNNETLKQITAAYSVLEASLKPQTGGGGIVTGDRGGTGGGRGGVTPRGQEPHEDDPSDPCWSNPCKNGGSCRRLDIFKDHGFYCICRDGYMQPTCSTECPYPKFGADCQRECKHCKRHHCHHVRGCEKCLLGFTNSLFRGCDILDCKFGRSPCKNLGACSSGHKKCKCRNQYTGELCETFIAPDFTKDFLPCEQEKQFKDCKNQGVCVLPRESQGTATSKCICKAEFFGELCQKSCASKVPGICENGDCSLKVVGGSRSERDETTCDCWDGYDGPKCDEKCEPGWYGAQCKYNCDDKHCLDPPCSHDIGFCTGGQCEKGWFGLRCDQRIHELMEKVSIRLKLSFEEELHDNQEGPQIRVPYEKLLDQDSKESKLLVMQFMSWMEKTLLATKRRINLRDIVITARSGSSGGFNIAEDEDRKRRQADVTSPLGIQCTIDLPTSHKNASAERRKVRALMKAEADQFEFEGLSISKDSIQLSRARLSTFADEDRSQDNGSHTRSPLISQLQAGVITAFVLVAFIVVVSGVLCRKRRAKTVQKNVRNRNLRLPDLKSYVQSRQTHNLQ